MADEGWTDSERAAYVAKLPLGKPKAPKALQKFLDMILAKTALPNPWVAQRDPHGRVYFANEATQSSSWGHPLEGALLEVGQVAGDLLALGDQDRDAAIRQQHGDWTQDAHAALGKWQPVDDGAGNEYYFHSETRETSWVNPEVELHASFAMKLEALGKLIDSVYVAQLMSLEPSPSSPSSPPARSSPGAESESPASPAPGQREEKQEKSPPSWGMAALVKAATAGGDPAVSKEPDIQADEEEQVIPSHVGARKATIGRDPGAPVGRWMQPVSYGKELGLTPDDSKTFDQKILDILMPVFQLEIPVPWTVKVTSDSTSYVHGGFDTRLTTREHPLKRVHGDLVQALKKCLSSKGRLRASQVRKEFAQLVPKVASSRMLGDFGTWKQASGGSDPVYVDSTGSKRRTDNPQLAAASYVGMALTATRVAWEKAMAADGSTDAFAHSDAEIWELAETLATGVMLGRVSNEAPAAEEPSALSGGAVEDLERRLEALEQQQEFNSEAHQLSEQMCAELEQDIERLRQEREEQHGEEMRQLAEWEKQTASLRTELEAARDEANASQQMQGTVDSSLIAEYEEEVNEALKLCESHVLGEEEAKAQQDVLAEQLLLEQDAARAALARAEEADQAQLELRELREELSAAADLGDAAHAAAERHRAELDDAARMSEELQQALEAAEAECDRYRREGDSSRAQLDSLDAIQEEMRGEKDDFLKQLQDMKAEIDDFREAKEHDRMENSELQELAARLQDESAELSQSVLDVRGEVEERWRAELDDLRAAFSEDSSRLDAAEAVEFERLQDSFAAELRSQQEAWAAEVEAAERQREDLVAAAKERLRAEFSEERDAWESRLQASEAALETSKTDLEDAWREELSAERAEVEEQFREQLRAERKTWTSEEAALASVAAAAAAGSASSAAETPKAVQEERFRERLSKEKEAWQAEVQAAQRQMAAAQSDAMSAARKAADLEQHAHAEKKRLRQERELLEAQVERQRSELADAMQAAASGALDATALPGQHGFAESQLTSSGGMGGLNISMSSGFSPPLLPPVAATSTDDYADMLALQARLQAECQAAAEAKAEAAAGALELDLVQRKLVRVSAVAARTRACDFYDHVQGHPS
eukprot:TRINITY_DN50819_c0_g1_i2.p1 TRINITY_DN50819_c0_g1~~TRINITY_DN50819_c0_g1_i2.p1  ORF type:complete len:1116 (+),score=377.75 TRINITY_DN50819_c0_g1_i2:128-3475(+)